MGERRAPTTGASSEPSAVRRRPGFRVLASLVARLSIPVMLVLWAITPRPLDEGDLWYQTYTASGADVSAQLSSLEVLPEHVPLWRPCRGGEFVPCDVPHDVSWVERHVKSADTPTPVPFRHSAWPGKIWQESSAPVEALFAWVDAPKSSRALRSALRRITVHRLDGTTAWNAIETAETRRVGGAVYVRFVCIPLRPRPSLLDALLDLF